MELLGTLMAGAGGIVATGATALVTNYINGLDKRSKSAKRDRAIEHALKRMQFLNIWVGLCPDEDNKRRVQPLMDELFLEYQRAIVECEEEEELANPAELGHLRRWSLFYMPNRPFGWVYRAFYYMTLFMLAFMAFVVMDVPAGQSCTALLPGFLIVSLPFWFILLFLKLWAIKDDQKIWNKKLEKKF